MSSVAPLVEGLAPSDGGSLSVAELKTALRRLAVEDTADCLSREDLEAKLRAARRPPELLALSIQQLREQLSAVHVTDVSDCLTKEDLVSRLVLARAAARHTTSTSTSFRTKRHATFLGYATDGFRQRYLDREIAAKRLPAEALRHPKVMSLEASLDPSDTLYFWQLFSVMGTGRIKTLVQQFYVRIFADRETWFQRAFADIAPLDHHVATQSAMWCDVLGGGRHYHGGEYRLSFHHQHNAMRVMTQAGAERWSMHMLDTLCAPSADLTSDLRVKGALLEFLRLAMDKYAIEFRFDSKYLLLDTTVGVKSKLEAAAPSSTAPSHKETPSAS